MYSPTAFSDGLERLVRNAMETARQAGQIDIVSRLEAVLSLTRSEASPAFELDILAAEVRRAGMTIALSRGERALLIALALRRRPCIREELVEMLYPHLDESTGATQLKVYVHRVRRRLGDPQTIAFAGDSYRLGNNVAVDFWGIEAEIAHAARTSDALGSEVLGRLESIRLRLLRRDVAWAGDREWATDLERRLEVLLFDVTARLGEAALAKRDIAAALSFATEIFNLDPCDERGARLMLRAHLAGGDRDAAARALRRYERVLREQFDVRPSQELAELVS